MRDEQPWTTCPRCRNTVYWTFSNPPAMPRFEEEYDPTDFLCGACLERQHFFTLVKEWREEGLDALREYRQWQRDRIARKAAAPAA